MAHENARAVSQSVIEPVGRDVAQVPAPRSPVPEPAAQDIAPPAPRPVFEPAARDISRPESRSRVGGLLIAGVAAAAAWALGWLAGVTWAWRKMTPRQLTRAVLR